MKNTQFSNLIMMYADHVMRGLRTIESVPALLREDIEWVIADSKKKPVDEE